MSRSELVSPTHLQRKALIYIRQSTPHQVLSNQESLRLQYALQQRAIDLGWRPEDIEIIDADLGMTGASGGRLRHEVDYCLCVPSEQTPRIQEAHTLLGHILCEIVEENFTDADALAPPMVEGL